MAGMRTKVDKREQKWTKVDADPAQALPEAAPSGGGAVLLGERRRRRRKHREKLPLLTPPALLQGGPWGPGRRRRPVPQVLEGERQAVVPHGERVLGPPRNPSRGGRSAAAEPGTVCGGHRVPGRRVGDEPGAGQYGTGVDAQ
eukprot:1192781-Prorocentrum_minimum.AAC.1